MPKPKPGSIVPPWEDDDAFFLEVLLDGWEEFDAEWWRRYGKASFGVVSFFGYDQEIIDRVWEAGMKILRAKGLDV